MKRCILVGSRVSKDKETGDTLLFMTLYRLPSKMSNGGLWHPKQGEAIINACVNGAKKPEEFEKFSKALPGALIDVTFGVNDFNGKTFVASMTLASAVNPFEEDVLYL